MVKTWGPYRAVRPLGEGGMGKVWEVEHAQSGGRYALKELLAVQVDADDHLRFVREAQALALLDHPNVVRVHAAELSGPTPYLVQELCVGSLRGRLHAGPLSSEEALRLARDLSAGLEHVHARGLVHRDLKPENVLFDASGRAKLADFGLTRSLASAEERLTQTGAVLGTPVYMAPEQALDAKQAGAPADVYACGLLIHEALTGVPAFDVQGGLLATLGRVVQDAPPRVTSLRLDAPPRLVRLCDDCLAKDPRARPSAASLVERVQAQAPQGVSRGWALAGALAVVVPLGVASVLWLRRSAPTQPPTPPAPRPSDLETSPPPESDSTSAWRELREAESLERRDDHGAHALVRFAAEHTLVALDGRLVLETWSRSATGWERGDPRGLAPPLERDLDVLCPTVLLPAGAGWVHGCGASYDGLSPPFPLSRDATPLAPLGPSCGVLVAPTRVLVGSVEGRVLEIDLEGPDSQLGMWTLGDDWITDMAAVSTQHVLVTSWDDSLKGYVSLLTLGEDAAVTQPIGPANCVAAHPTGMWAVVGTTAGTMAVLDVSEPPALAVRGWVKGGVATGARLPQAHDGPIRAVAFSADGSRLFSLAAGRESELTSWRVGEGAPPSLEREARFSFPAGDLPYSLAVSPAGVVAVGMRSGEVLVLPAPERWR